MRMRKKKHGAERIEKCAMLLIKNPEELKSDPYSVFPNKEGKLCIEIGCGKGDFACGITKKNKNDNLIAIEMNSDACCVALEKAMAQKQAEENDETDNLRFIIGNANNLEEWFPEHCLDVIYLNFSDPWHKSGHAKRRLTYRGFLQKYRRLLKNGGELIFKTDNAALFDFSLEEFAAEGLELVYVTRDLHASDKASDNIMTEYERNFSEKGFKINMAVVRFI